MNCGCKWKKLMKESEKKNARFFYLPNFRIMSCYSIKHGGNQCSLLFEVLNFCICLCFNLLQLLFSLKPNCPNFDQGETFQLTPAAFDIT